MPQVKTNTAKIYDIIGSPYFVMGYNDYLSAKGFVDDYDNLSTHKQWRYERGRLFAAATQGKVVLFVSNKVTQIAIDTYKNLRAECSII